MTHSFFYFAATRDPLPLRESALRWVSFERLIGKVPITFCRVGIGFEFCFAHLFFFFFGTLLQGKRIHVYVDETRPLLQGGRLTAYELQREGIPYTLICDNMAASLMRDGKIQRCFVGADRIALNGDFANKIGT